LSPLIGIVNRARLRAKHDESPAYAMRRPGSTLSARIDPDDVRGRYVSSSRTPGNLHYRPDPPEGPQVIDDFGEVTPVTQRELDTIETYLGALLDDMLMRMG
jgi:hypothetical protein